MTETLMNTAVHARRRPPPRAGRPAAARRRPAPRRRRGDDAGAETRRDPGARAEPLPRLPQPAGRDRRGHDADGWFRTGDLATRDPDGYIRIVGRRATDLIKSGGYKIGAGEIENALLEHPGGAEAAVTGEPDEDLGERIVAWVVVARRRRARPRELADHVARLLTPHKRPRVVRYVEALPRNAMGKVQKKLLTPLITTFHATRGSRSTRTPAGSPSPEHPHRASGGCSSRSRGRGG